VISLLALDVHKILVNVAWGAFLVDVFLSLSHSYPLGSDIVAAHFKVFLRQCFLRP
jgi:hypothetical protein